MCSLLCCTIATKTNTHGDSQSEINSLRARSLGSAAKRKHLGWKENRKTKLIFCQRTEQRGRLQLEWNLRTSDESQWIQKRSWKWRPARFRNWTPGTSQKHAWGFHCSWGGATKSSECAQIFMMLIKVAPKWVPLKGAKAHHAGHHGGWGTRMPRTPCFQHKGYNALPGQPFWGRRTFCLQESFHGVSQFLTRAVHQEVQPPHCPFFPPWSQSIQLQSLWLLLIQMHISLLAAVNYRTFRFYWLVGRDTGKEKGRGFLCYTASKPKPNTQVKCLIPKGHPGKQAQA